MRRTLGTLALAIALGAVLAGTASAASLTINGSIQGSGGGRLTRLVVSGAGPTTLTVKRPGRRSAEGDHAPLGLCVKGRTRGVGNGHVAVPTTP